MRRKLLEPEHPFIASALEDVAWAASGLHQFEEAQRLDAEALVMRQHLFGEAHPDVARNLNALGQLLGNQNELPAADAVLRATLSIQRKLVGDDDQATLETLDALGKVLAREGKTEEAESVLREALVVWHQRGGDEKSDRLYTLRALGETLEHDGKWADAEGIWRESLVLWRKRGGTEEQQSMYTLRKLGLALEAQHNWVEAESVWREALSLSRKKGEEDSEALADLERLVRVLANERKFAEAQDFLDKVLTPAFVMQSSSVNLLVQRVNIMGRRGRWQEAAADAALALDNQPTDHYRFHTLIGLLAMTHDRSAYEQICKRLVTKFPNPTNPFIAERIAQDCLLLPDSGVDLELMDNLADAAVTLGNGDSSMPYFLACKAMSSYRLGRFREAIDWGGKAIKGPAAEPQAKAKAFAALAMANWRLGQKDEARTALVNGDALAPDLLPETDGQDLGESWVAWLMARVSLDEATELMSSGLPADGLGVSRPAAH
jgi:tetratricopeptide (TPR) repeat protein